MPLPAISVVIPAYNRPDLLRETVATILAQTLPPSEILVVDDGSPTPLPPDLQDLGPTVRLLRQTNAGITAARNTGVLHATSPWIAFCDHDDLWRPDKLEQQLRLHLDHPDLLYSFTDFRIVSGDTWSPQTKLSTLPPDFFTPAHPEPTPTGDLILRRSLHNRILDRQPIWPSTVLISRALFDRIGGFRPELGRNISEDLEFTLRCLRQPPTGVLLQPLVGVRKHPGNTSHDHALATLHQVEILEHVLAHHNLPPETRAVIQQGIHRRLLLRAQTAFADRQFQLHRQLLREIPDSQLSPKDHVKQAIASLPQPLARRLSNLLLRPGRDRTRFAA